MALKSFGASLELIDAPKPIPQAGEVLIEVGVCGVCRTDLHILDGELPPPKLPLISGHQIVGRIAQIGEGISRLKIGDRIGVPWLAQICESCRDCTSGRENLCRKAKFTGFHRDGGYAEFAAAAADYCHPLPTEVDDLHAAPMLCEAEQDESLLIIGRKRRSVTIFFIPLLF